MTRAYYKRWSLFYSLIRALNNLQTFNKNKPFMQKQLVVLACRGEWEGISVAKLICVLRIFFLND